MTLVLVAHGTRDPAGARVVDELAFRVRARLRVPVEVVFADVRPPTVDSVLRRVSGRAVVVPCFLSSGYHVRVDVPAQVAGRALITPPLGPAPTLIATMHDRLRAAGYRGGDVIMAAAGSADPQALADVRRAAALLSLRTGTPVRIRYVTTTFPRVGDAAVASWLLAPGLFHRAVATCGAPVIAAPLGAHPWVVELIARRYTEAGPPAPDSCRVSTGSPPPTRPGTPHPPGTEPPHPQ